MHHILSVLEVILLPALIVSTSGRCPEKCICDFNAVSCSKQIIGDDHNLTSLVSILTKGNWEEVEFTNNPIPYMYFNFSELLPWQVKVVKLTNNNISEIDPPCFHYFRELTHLNLSRNMLPSLNATFNEVNRVIEVDLSQNKLRKVEIKNSENLRNLFLNHNQINDLRFIRNFRKLRILSLAYNDIEQIPEDTFSNHSLRIIYLNNNRIKDISFVRGFINAREIYLGNNYISSISNEFNKVVNVLEVLSLTNNSIKNASFLQYMTKSFLNTLDLSFNEITKFSRKDFYFELKKGQFVCRFTSLKNFFINNNFIRHLEQGLFRCPGSTNRIEVLHASNNLLNETEFLQHFRQIKEVDLSSNNIHTIMDYVAQKISTIEVLDLSFNRLENVNFIMKMTKLVYLNLEYNYISSIHPDLYRGVDNSLQKLLLNKNPIDDIQFTCFTRNLVYITLHNVIIRKRATSWEGGPGNEMPSAEYLRKKCLQRACSSEIPRYRTCSSASILHGLTAPLLPIVIFISAFIFPHRPI